MRGNFIWCVVPPYGDHSFSPLMKLVRKYQRNPYVTVHTRKDNHLFPSLDENAKESFDLAFELAFHSILLLSCRALAYFNAPRQKDLANCNLFQNFQFRGWLRIVSFSFWRRIQSRNITKQLKKESKLAFLAVLFSRGIRVLRFIAVSNGGQEQ